MEQKSIRDILKSTKVVVDGDEYDALIDFLEFMKNREYGEFKAVINTDPRTRLREILVNVTNKSKRRLKTVVTVRTQ